MVLLAGCHDPSRTREPGARTQLRDGRDPEQYPRVPVRQGPEQRVPLCLLEQGFRGIFPHSGFAGPGADRFRNFPAPVRRREVPARRPGVAAYRSAAGDGRRVYGRVGRNACGDDFQGAGAVGGPSAADYRHFVGYHRTEERRA